MTNSTTGQPLGPQGIVFAAAAVALCLWGGTPVATKIAVGSLDPVSVGLLRSVAAGLIAGPLALALRLPFPKAARERALLMVSGIASFAVWPALLSVGIGMTSANHAGLIIALIPIFTGIFAALLERRAPALKWWLGGGIAMAGTVLLAMDTDGPSGQGASVAGDLIVLLGVTVCAVGYLAGGKLSAGIGTMATTFWGLALTSILLLPIVAALADRTDWPSVTAPGWTALAYLAVAGTFGSYLLWFWALGRGGITRVSSWQLVQPVITIVFAALLLAEPLTTTLLAAAGVVIAGTALAQLPKRRRRA